MWYCIDERYLIKQFNEPSQTARGAIIIKPTAYLCTNFESLKKLITLLSETDWELLSPETRRWITASYICYGDKTTVVFENGGISIFEFGTRKDVSYTIFSHKN